MLFYQLLTITLLSALVFFPEQIDVRISYGIIGFAILLLPLFVKNLKENIEKGDTITAFFILFLIFCSISTIFSIDQNRSIQQLLLYHAYFVVFISIRSVFPTQKSRELLAYCLLLVTSLLSLVSLYYTLVLHYISRETDGVSFIWVYYGHNHLSALLIFVIPVSLYFLKTYWHTKKLNIVLLVNCYLLIITLFLCFSRASLLSLLFAASFAGLLFRIVPKGKILLFIFIILGITATSILSINSAKELGIAKYSIQSPARPIYWKTAIANGVSHPFTGTGLDTFRHLDTIPPTLKTDFTHNFFLQIFSDTGILGFLASVLLIGSILWKGFKRNQKLLSISFFTGLLASTLNSMVDFDWQIAIVFLLFWIVAGLLTAKD